jgi:hypothetical protein
MQHMQLQYSCSCNTHAAAVLMQLQYSCSCSTHAAAVLMQLQYSCSCSTHVHRPAGQGLDSRLTYDVTSGMPASPCAGARCHLKHHWVRAPEPTCCHWHAAAAHGLGGARHAASLAGQGVGVARAGAAGAVVVPAAEVAWSHQQGQPQAAASGIDLQLHHVYSTRRRVDLAKHRADES